MDELRRLIDSLEDSVFLMVRDLIDHDFVLQSLNIWDNDFFFSVIGQTSGLCECLCICYEAIWITRDLYLSDNSQVGANG